ncbi:peptidoglycan-binding domain-containing protein [Kribbella capetownensis]|uniref:peptidoglycan-binding domain-containing protein n=1 Tax=Kribbella capetownensis TaxID=1572659 RepID=UPI003B50C1BD
MSALVRASCTTRWATSSALPADGQVGRLTWEQLVVPLQQGSTGSAVRAIQSELTAHGIPTAIDGDFGPATTSHVRIFQTLNALPTTGTVDTTNWLYLEGT